MSQNYRSSDATNRFRGGGLWGGISFIWDPGRYVNKVSGYGHLSPWGTLSQPRGTWYVVGDSYTGDFDR